MDKKEDKKSDAPAVIANPSPGHTFFGQPTLRHRTIVSLKDFVLGINLKTLAARMRHVTENGDFKSGTHHPKCSRKKNNLETR